MPKRIGRNWSIISLGTIKMRDEMAVPVIADDVPIRVGARVLGGTVLGRGVKIVVYAVVFDDLPAWATAMDAPAKLVCAKELSPH